MSNIGPTTVNTALHPPTIPSTSSTSSAISTSSVTLPSSVILPQTKSLPSSTSQQPNTTTRPNPLLALNAASIPLSGSQNATMSNGGPTPPSTTAGSGPSINSLVDIRVTGGVHTDGNGVNTTSQVGTNAGHGVGNVNLNNGPIQTVGGVLTNAHSITNSITGSSQPPNTSSLPSSTMTTGPNNGNIIGINDNGGLLAPLVTRPLSITNPGTVPALSNLPLTSSNMNTIPLSASNTNNINTIPNMNSTAARSINSTTTPIIAGVLSNPNSNSEVMPRITSTAMQLQQQQLQQTQPQQSQSQQTHSSVLKSSQPSSSLSPLPSTSTLGMRTTRFNNQSVTNISTNDDLVTNNNTNIGDGLDVLNNNNNNTNNNHHHPHNGMKTTRPQFPQRLPLLFSTQITTSLPQTMIPTPHLVSTFDNNTTNHRGNNNSSVNNTTNNNNMSVGLNITSPSILPHNHHHQAFSTLGTPFGRNNAGYINSMIQGLCGGSSNQNRNNNNNNNKFGSDINSTNNSNNGNNNTNMTNITNTNTPIINMSNNTNTINNINIPSSSSNADGAIEFEFVFGVSKGKLHMLNVNQTATNSNPGNNNTTTNTTTTNNNHSNNNTKSINNNNNNNTTSHDLYQIPSSSSTTSTISTITPTGHPNMKMNSINGRFQLQNGTSTTTNNNNNGMSNNNNNGKTQTPSLPPNSPRSTTTIITTNPSLQQQNGANSLSSVQNGPNSLSLNTQPSTLSSSTSINPPPSLSILTSPMSNSLVNGSSNNNGNNLSNIVNNIPSAFKHRGPSALRSLPHPQLFSPTIVIGVNNNKIAPNNTSNNSFDYVKQISSLTTTNNPIVTTPHGAAGGLIKNLLPSSNGLSSLDSMYRSIPNGQNNTQNHQNNTQNHQNHPNNPNKSADQAFHPRQTHAPTTSFGLHPGLGNNLGLNALNGNVWNCHNNGGLGGFHSSNTASGTTEGFKSVLSRPDLSIDTNISLKQQVKLTKQQRERASQQYYSNNSLTKCDFYGKQCDPNDKQHDFPGIMGGLHGLHAGNIVNNASNVIDDGDTSMTDGENGMNNNNNSRPNSHYVQHHSYHDNKNFNNTLTTTSEFNSAASQGTRASSRSALKIMVLEDEYYDGNEGDIHHLDFNNNNNNNNNFIHNNPNNIDLNMTDDHDYTSNSKLSRGQQQGRRSTRPNEKTTRGGRGTINSTNNQSLITSHPIPPTAIPTAPRNTRKKNLSLDHTTTRNGADLTNNNGQNVANLAQNGTNNPPLTHYRKKQLMMQLPPPKSARQLALYHQRRGDYDDMGSTDVNNFSEAGKAANVNDGDTGIHGNRSQYHFQNGSINQNNASVTSEKRLILNSHGTGVIHVDDGPVDHETPIEMDLTVPNIIAQQQHDYFRNTYSHTPPQQYGGLAFLCPPSKPFAEIQSMTVDEQIQFMQAFKRSIEDAIEDSRQQTEDALLAIGNSFLVELSEMTSTSAPVSSNVANLVRDPPVGHDNAANTATTATTTNNNNNNVQNNPNNNNTDRNQRKLTTTATLGSGDNNTTTSPPLQPLTTTTSTTGNNKTNTLTTTSLTTISSSTSSKPSNGTVITGSTMNQDDTKSNDNDLITQNIPNNNLIITNRIIQQPKYAPVSKLSSLNPELNQYLLPVDEDLGYDINHPVLLHLCLAQPNAARAAPSLSSTWAATPPPHFKHKQLLLERQWVLDQLEYLYNYGRFDGLFLEQSGTIASVNNNNVNNNKQKDRNALQQNNLIIEGFNPHYEPHNPNSFPQPINAASVHLDRYRRLLKGEDLKKPNFAFKIPQPNGAGIIVTDPSRIYAHLPPVFSNHTPLPIPVCAIKPGKYAGLDGNEILAAMNMTPQEGRRFLLFSDLTTMQTVLLHREFQYLKLLEYRARLHRGEVFPVLSSVRGCNTSQSAVHGHTTTIVTNNNNNNVNNLVGNNNNNGLTNHLPQLLPPPHQTLNQLQQLHSSLSNSNQNNSSYNPFATTPTGGAKSFNTLNPSTGTLGSGNIPSIANSSLVCFGSLLGSSSNVQNATIMCDDNDNNTNNDKKNQKGGLLSFQSQALPSQPLQVEQHQHSSRSLMGGTALPFVTNGLNQQLKLPLAVQSLPMSNSGGTLAPSSSLQQQQQPQNKIQQGNDATLTTTSSVPLPMNTKVFTSPTITTTTVPMNTSAISAIPKITTNATVNSMTNNHNNNNNDDNDNNKDNNTTTTITTPPLHATNSNNNNTPLMEPCNPSPRRYPLLASLPLNQFEHTLPSGLNHNNIYSSAVLPPPPHHLIMKIHLHQISIHHTQPKLPPTNHHNHSDGALQSFLSQNDHNDPIHKFDKEHLPLNMNPISLDFNSRTSCLSCCTKVSSYWREPWKGIRLCNSCALRYKKICVSCTACLHIPYCQELKRSPSICLKCNSLLLHYTE